jgi:NTE family protein
MAPAKALVLGRGGVTGIAWMTGLLAGLAEAGVRLDDADLMVGTSAGSVVGAQLRLGVPLKDLYETQLADPAGEIPARMGPGFYVRFIGTALFAGSDEKARARIGRAALRTKTVPEAERLAAIRTRLSSDQWPEGRLKVVAVDAETGEPAIFDRDGDATVLEAVAASCAVPIIWPPISIRGHRYVDGGVRSIANADLATGCERVVVLAPATFAMRRSGRIGTQLASLGPQVRSLVISPDAESKRAIGSNVLDPARRPASARAGHAQAATVAEAVNSTWY